MLINIVLVDVPLGISVLLAQLAFLSAITSSQLSMAISSLFAQNCGSQYKVVIVFMRSQLSIYIESRF